VLPDFDKTPNGDRDRRRPQLVRGVEAAGADSLITIIVVPIVMIMLLIDTIPLVPIVMIILLIDTITVVPS